MLTICGAASVRTPTVPIGQSELSMSTVCLARKPGGVLMLIWDAESAALGDADGVEQPQTRAPDRATVTNDVAARNRPRLALLLGA